MDFYKTKEKIFPPLSFIVESGGKIFSLVL